MTPRTGRRRELVEGQTMTLYVDGPTAEYLRSLPNASRWVREIVGVEDEVKRLKNELDQAKRRHIEDITVILVAAGGIVKIDDSHKIDADKKGVLVDRAPDGVTTLRVVDVGRKARAQAEDERGKA